MTKEETKRRQLPTPKSKGASSTVFNLEEKSSEDIIKKYQEIIDSQNIVIDKNNELSATQIRILEKLEQENKALKDELSSLKAQQQSQLKVDDQASLRAQNVKLQQEIEVLSKKNADLIKEIESLKKAGELKVVDSDKQQKDAVAQLQMSLLQMQTVQDKANKEYKAQLQVLNSEIERLKKLQLSQLLKSVYRIKMLEMENKLLKDKFSIKEESLVEKSYDKEALVKQFEATDTKIEQLKDVDNLDEINKGLQAILRDIVQNIKDECVVSNSFAVVSCYKKLYHHGRSPSADDAKDAYSNIERIENVSKKNIEEVIKIISEICEKVDLSIKKNVLENLQKFQKINNLVKECFDANCESFEKIVQPSSTNEPDDSKFRIVELEDVREIATQRFDISTESSGANKPSSRIKHQTTDLPTRDEYKHPSHV